MNYQILAQTYDGRWDLIDSKLRRYDEVHNRLVKINPNDYYEYMVIQEASKHNIVELGKFNKSKIKIKKL